MLKFVAGAKAQTKGCILCFQGKEEELEEGELWATQGEYIWITPLRLGQNRRK
jgi:hypothetical protein